LFAKNIGLDLNPATFETLGRTANWWPGGFTANVFQIGDRLEAIVNPTREMVMDGGVPVSAGDEIRQLVQDGAGWVWKTWHTF